ncbi:MAG TPA: hypothetical protein P5250_08410, partial [Bacteroidales bacterium]|nr:hypothetical protein [Bacteroidales bacterium]
MKNLLLFVFYFLLLKSNLFAQEKIFYNDDANQIIQGTSLLRFKDYHEIPDFIKFADNTNISL